MSLELDQHDPSINFIVIDALDPNPDSIAFPIHSDDRYVAHVPKRGWADGLLESHVSKFLLEPLQRIVRKPAMPKGNRHRIAKQVQTCFDVERDGRVIVFAFDRIEVESKFVRSAQLDFHERLSLFTHYALFMRLRIE